jgi:predicted O-methyltransferase YrrM
MIFAPGIEDYLASVRQARDPILLEMEERARERGFPIVGPDAGRLLHILAVAARARRVLELGSGYGYSAYWLARALPEGGEVICTDRDPENREAALAYFARAGLQEKLRFEVGDALEALDRLRGPFDLIFNDVDKRDYPAVIARVVPRLPIGGLFVTDNTLWKGKVAERGEPDEQTAAVLEFNRAVAAHPQLDVVILPLRDGVTVAMRRS